MFCVALRPRPVEGHALARPFLLSAVRVNPAPVLCRAPDRAQGGSHGRLERTESGSPNSHASGHESQAQAECDCWSHHHGGPVAYLRSLQTLFGSGRAGRARFTHFYRCVGVGFDGDATEVEWTPIRERRTADTENHGCGPAMSGCWCGASPAAMSAPPVCKPWSIPAAGDMPLIHLRFRLQPWSFHYSPMARAGSLQCNVVSRCCTRSACAAALACSAVLRWIAT